MNVILKKYCDSDDDDEEEEELTTSHIHVF